MTKGKKKIITMSIFYLIIMTAYSSFQTIITKVHEEEGDSALGPFSFVIYYSVGLGIMLITAKTKVAQKWQMTFSTIGYIINYSTGIFMIGASVQYKYVLVGIGAIINGICSSYLWVCVGRYIHNICVQHDELDRKGQYYGLFSSIYTSSAVIGAIIVTFGLDWLSHRNYFILVTGIAVLALLYCWIFVPDVRSSQKYSQNAEQEPTVKEQMIRTLKYYPKMKYMLGYIFLDGINVAISVVTLHHLYQSTGDQHRDQLNAGIALLAYGFGCVSGGYMGGRLCDTFSVKFTAYIGHYLFIMNCILSIIVSLLDLFPLSCVACFFWGYLVYYTQANEMVICSKLFKGKSESFSVMKQFHACSLIIYEVISMLTHNSIPVGFLMSGALLFAFPSLYLINKLSQVKEVSLITNINEEEQEQMSKDEDCN